MFEGLEIIFRDRLLVGECPTWDERTHELLYVDIRGKCYYRMNYGTGRTEQIGVPQMLGCFALCDNGDVLLSMEDGIYRRSTDGQLRLAHQAVQIRGDRFNDGKVGIDGCYYVGTAGADFSGAFYRLQGERLDLLFDGCGCSNGIDWNGDGTTLYYCDSHLHRLEKFSFDAEAHALSSREPILDIPAEIGSGDGLTIDAEGNIWLAIWGGSCLWHIDPVKRRVLQELKIPAKQVSSCCFAGPDLRDLIITTAAVRTEEASDPHAGNIFRYRPAVGGLTMNKFISEKR